ncbi:MAG: DUF3267 domain-containing protein [Ruminococcus sp.]|nr:DUF3267 domain-containing protein [Ruminococcus sp.]MCM1381600.1 DUF3267 domain-containing protein [Muribaculaceae bacterium]MCM1480967.1 DUF3267 domain-containing protein [Muribaculaceae bacterium]
MKITFKGLFKSYDELPKGNLPSGAVKLKEPDSFAVLNLLSLAIALPLAYGLLAIVRLRMDFAEEFRPMLLPGILAALACLVPHEIIHGLAMGGEAFIYFSPRNFLAFCISLSPMSKARFFFMGIAPSFILGWTPFAFAMVFPDLPISGFTAVTACINIITGSGDLVKIFLAEVQPPKGSLIQFSGIELYWYEPRF